MFLHVQREAREVPGRRLEISVRGLFLLLYLPWLPWYGPVFIIT
jgi:hypothetical protein